MVCQEKADLKVNLIQGGRSSSETLFLYKKDTEDAGMVLVHKEVPEADDKKVPEADDKTSGECLPLTHGVGGGQKGQGLQKPHLHQTHLP